MSDNPSNSKGIADILNKYPDWRGRLEILLSGNCVLVIEREDQ